MILFFSGTKSLYGESIAPIVWPAFAAVQVRQLSTENTAGSCRATFARKATKHKMTGISNKKRNANLKRFFFK